MKPAPSPSTMGLKMAAPPSSVPWASSDPEETVGSIVHVTTSKGSAPARAMFRLTSKAVPAKPGFSRLTVPDGSEPPSLPEDAADDPCPPSPAVSEDEETRPLPASVSDSAEEVASESPPHATITAAATHAASRTRPNLDRHRSEGRRTPVGIIMLRLPHSRPTR